MIIWGGTSSGTCFSDSARFNLVGSNWTPLASTEAPAGRYTRSAVRTGNKMVIWSTYNARGYLGDTAAYSSPNTIYLYLKP